jgi:hypothetical protein
LEYDKAVSRASGGNGYRVTDIKQWILNGGECVKTIQLREHGVPLKKKWRACVGAGSAVKGLRADWQRQFGMAIQQCGFERARLGGWNLLDREDVREADALCDFLTDLTIAPIVRLDAHDGSEDLEAFARHAIARYGARRAHTWRFEIPLNDEFEKRARTLKSTDAELNVGALTTPSQLGKGELPADADCVVLAGSPDESSLSHIRDKLGELSESLSVHWDGVASAHPIEKGLRDAVLLTKQHLSGGLPVDSLSLVSFSGICGAGAYLVDGWGVRQPSGHAHRMMDALGDEEIERGGGYIITRDEQGSVRALAWTDASNPDEVEIAGFAPHSKLMIETLDGEHGWAYPTWRQMGCPKLLGRYQAQALRQAALRTDVTWARADEHGRFRWKLPKTEDSIILLKE